MTLNFPADPQLNDEYSFGTKTWAYNGFGWKLKTADDVIFSSTVRANSEFFIANGAVTSFTLTSTDLIGKVNNSIVTVDGLTQIPGLQYNASANSIVFSATPVANSLIEIRLFEVVDANSVIEIREFVPGNSFFTLVYDEANNALDTSNIALDTANAAFDASNIAFDTANAAFDQANLDVTTISTTNGVFGNSTHVPVVTLESNGRVSSITTEEIVGGGGGGGTITFDTDPPESGNSVGDIWIDSNSGIKYHFFDDGDTFQWVEFGPGAIAEEIDLLAVTTDIIPLQSNVSVLGSPTKQWKDVYLSGNLSLSGDVTGNLTPSISNTYNLGSSTHQWKDAYLSGNLSISGRVSGNLDPITTNTSSLGSSTHQWKDAYLSGNLSISGEVTGNVIPSVTETFDLGTASKRWRNIFTSDLSLNNGIGDWTIVEGEDDLFLYNNKKNKVYKFAIIEVDPSEATPKIEDLRKS
jgi:cytoskeletal protein CcmA (bactofilin family)